jgi:hypothetical protein
MKRQPPTSKDLEPLAVAYRQAYRMCENARYAPAYGVLERAVARLLGFTCTRCGTTTDGSAKMCDHCSGELAKNAAARAAVAEVIAR